MEREVSIIIPARNEAANLPPLLESILSQARQPLEVLVVDDDSEDGTAAVAESAGATVIRSEPLPAGWRGKTWACAQGANHAKGRLLLFLDADCRFEEGGLSELLHRYQGGAFAVCPYHRVERAYESLSAFFNLIMVAGTVRKGLCGQCLLVDRETYRQAGGYHAVRSAILENVMFADPLRSTGSRIATIPGKGILSFRMYPDGIASVVEGWTKGFVAGAASTPKPDLVLISIWISSLILGIVAPFFFAAGWLIYTAFALQLAAMLRRVGNFPFLTAALYPVALAFYLAVFLRALGPAGKQVTWKGRSLHAP